MNFTRGDDRVPSSPFEIQYLSPGGGDDSFGDFFDLSSQNDNGSEIEGNSEIHDRSETATRVLGNTSLPSNILEILGPNEEESLDKFVSEDYSIFTNLFPGDSDEDIDEVFDADDIFNTDANTAIDIDNNGSLSVTTTATTTSNTFTGRNRGNEEVSSLAEANQIRTTFHQRESITTLFPPSPATPPLDEVGFLQNTQMTIRNSRAKKAAQTAPIIVKFASRQTPEHEAVPSSLAPSLPNQTESERAGIIPPTESTNGESNTGVREEEEEEDVEATHFLLDLKKSNESYTITTREEAEDTVVNNESGSASGTKNTPPSPPNPSVPRRETRSIRAEVSKARELIEQLNRIEIGYQELQRRKNALQQQQQQQQQQQVDVESNRERAFTSLSTVSQQTLPSLQVQNAILEKEREILDRRGAILLQEHIRLQALLNSVSAEATATARQEFDKDGAEREEERRRTVSSAERAIAEIQSVAVNAVNLFINKRIDVKDLRTVLAGQYVNAVKVSQTLTLIARKDAPILSLQEITASLLQQISLLYQGSPASALNNPASVALPNTLSIAAPTPARFSANTAVASSSSSSSSSLTTLPAPISFPRTQNAVTTSLSTHSDILRNHTFSRSLPTALFLRGPLPPVPAATLPSGSLNLPSEAVYALNRTPDTNEALVQSRKRPAASASAETNAAILETTEMIEPNDMEGVELIVGESAQNRIMETETETETVTVTVKSRKRARKEAAFFLESPFQHVDYTVSANTRVWGGTGHTAVSSNGNDRWVRIRISVQPPHGKRFIDGVQNTDIVFNTKTCQLIPSAWNNLTTHVGENDPALLNDAEKGGYRYIDEAYDKVPSSEIIDVSVEDEPVAVRRLRAKFYTRFQASDFQDEVLVTQSIFEKDKTTGIPFAFLPLPITDAIPYAPNRVFSTGFRPVEAVRINRIFEININSDGPWKFPFIVFASGKLLATHAVAARPILTRKELLTYLVEHKKRDRLKRIVFPNLPDHAYEPRDVKFIGSSIDVNPLSPNYPPRSRIEGNANAKYKASTGIYQKKYETTLRPFDIEDYDPDDELIVTLNFRRADFDL